MREGLACYYARVVASAQRAFTELRAVAKANQKVLGAKGELSDEAAAAYDRARKLHERLFTGAQQLAELLGEDVPVMAEEEVSNPNP